MLRPTPPRVPATPSVRWSLLVPTMLVIGCNDPSPNPTDISPDTPPTDTFVDAGPTPCTSNGLARCTSTSTLETCIDGFWQADPCPGLTVCDTDACLQPVCNPDDPAERTCIDATTASACPAPGTRRVTTPCPAGPCRDGLCTEGCIPDSRRCDGATIVVCNADFTETPTDTCTSNEHCIEGRCISNCELAGLKRGYLGCHYLAADLPNDASAMDNLFAFTFANASATNTATVTVTSPWGTTDTVTVEPGGIGIHPLPVPRFLSQITAPGFRDAAFFIDSDEPIAAVMFNPLQRFDADTNATVATNDASLLIPRAALGLDHIAMTWSDPGQFSRPPFVVIVADTDDTEVTIVSPETIVMSMAPFAIPRNTPTTVVMRRGQTLNLEPTPTPGQRTDMAGTRVTSAVHPVAVFSGNRCARVPDSGRFCDHVETQVPPVPSLGREHVVTRFADRGDAVDHLRVIATADDTTLVFDPPRAPVTLAAGQIHTFTTDADFVLTSNHPVLVGQFMASQNQTSPDGPFGQSPDCPPEFAGSCIGDPSLVLAAPVSQWRQDLVFLVPDTYRHTFVNIAFRDGTTITLDGETLATETALTIGSSPWKSLTLPMDAGRHTLRGSHPLGAIVYGYDHNISFAYNAGLDFR